MHVVNRECVHESVFTSVGGHLRGIATVLMYSDFADVADWHGIG